MNNGTMINKVFLSGVISGKVEDVGQEGQARHVVFDLTVPHRTREGEEKKEVYRINAWNGCAGFCLMSLSTGMEVALQGYLGQRTLYVGGRPVTVTEVHANLVNAPKRAEPAEPVVSGKARRDLDAMLSDLDAEAGG